MDNKKVISIAIVLVAAIGIAVVCGVFGTSPAAIPSDADQAGTYTSQDAAISFTYPLVYRLEERTDGFEGKTIDVVTLIDRNAVIPDYSEGPPVISLLIIPNPENLPLDEWIRTKSISNWQLSNVGEMGASTVGNETGLGYTYSGLYENTAVAVSHAGNVYLFSVGTLRADDQIKTDFFNLLDSVIFK